MNFRDFIGAAEVHLRMTGWLICGNNGVWRKYKKRDSTAEGLPLPGAICAEVRENNVFEPTIERYLVENGWRRTSSGVSSGWPTYRKGDKAKKLPEALLKQLMEDRMDRATVAPHTTPSEMKKLLDVTALRNSSPPPNGYANTAPARR